MTELAVIDIELPTLPELPDAWHAIKALPEKQRLVLLDAILDHYENGASIYAIAEQLGVHNATLYRNLKKYRLEDWKEIATSRYECEIEEAEKELKEAPDNNAVTRARERIASARWRLERLDRRIYGQEREAGSTERISINLYLGAAQTAQDSTQVVDGTVIRD
jgi:transposase-like protein